LEVPLAYLLNENQALFSAKLQHLMPTQQQGLQRLQLLEMFELVFECFICSSEA
jgi:hypothetical protein